MKFKLITAEYIDVEGRFQMVEGKFLDLEQKEIWNKEIYVYANISNSETEIEDSYVRYYANPVYYTYCAEDYELKNLEEYDDEVKEQLVNSDAYKEHFTETEIEIETIDEKPMTIDELLEQESELYDLVFDPQSMEWGNEDEVKNLIVKDPYGFIYGLVQSMKEMEKELGWR